MKFDAGDLTELITIRQQAPGQDDNGQPNGAWSDAGTEWASMRQMNGLETIRADAQTAVVRASFRIRWREGYTTAMRVLHNGVEYNIRALQPDRIGRQYVDLVCEGI